MADQVYAGLDPRAPHAEIAIDLTVNGEPMHFDQRVPLAIWDEMTPDRRADLALYTIHQGLWQLAAKFADSVTVTRDERDLR